MITISSFNIYLHFALHCLVLIGLFILALF